MTRGSLAAKPRARGRSIAVAVLAAFVLLMLPNAQTAVAGSTAFLPSYFTAVVIASVLTAYLLVHSFVISGSRRALALSWAYCVTAALAIVTALASPGVVTTEGLLPGVAAETFLWTVWQAGFAVLLAVAAAPWPARLRAEGVAVRRRPRVVLGSLLVIGAAIGGLVAFLTRSPDAVPFAGATSWDAVGVTVVAVNVVALVLVGLGSAQDATVKPWVLVASAAAAGSVALSVAGGARDTLGWYTGQVAGIAAATVVLLGLIAELNRLARDLAWSSQRLREQATTDALTRLLNRRTGLELGEAACTAARATGYGLAVALVDIDHFKHVNDEHGHGVGDDVLVTVARRMESALRDGDILCRYGGEEFLVLLPHASGAQAEAVAARLLEAVRQDPVMTSAGALPITASLGLTMWVRGEGLSKTLARADEALYAAKDAGRDRVVVRVPADDDGDAPSGLVGLPPVALEPLTDEELADPRVAYELARFGGMSVPAERDDVPAPRLPEPSPLATPIGATPVAATPQPALPVPGLPAHV